MKNCNYIYNGISYSDTEFEAIIKEKELNKFVINPTSVVHEVFHASFNRLSKEKQEELLNEGSQLFGIPRGKRDIDQKLYQIVGENANLSQDILDNLKVAKEMELANKDAKTIRLSTGWEKGVDDKWRYEIEPLITFQELTAIKYDPNFKEIYLGDSRSIKIAELIKIYPNLALTKIKKTNDPLISGQYTPFPFDTIELNVEGKDTDQLASTLSHEIQHAIQKIEGFGFGGSPLDVNKILLSLPPKDLKKLLNVKKIKEWLGENATEQTLREYAIEEVFSLDNIAMDIYKAISGEVEARNVEKRRSLTPEQRNQLLLSETEDVARDQQIVLRNEVIKYQQENQINYTLKSADILQSDKAKTLFKTLEKNKVTGDNFWKKIQELGIPKEQLELLKQYNTTNREELITNMLGDYSFVVESNITNEWEVSNYKGNPIFAYEGYHYSSEGDGFYNKRPSAGDWNDVTHISKDEFFKLLKQWQKRPGHYSNLTVQGGTNYTENEISTPLITPSIKGHAEFASDKGIGWFRSDDKLAFTGFLEDLIASGTIKKVPCG